MMMVHPAHSGSLDRGAADEWHLDISNSLEHTEFDLPSRPRQPVVPHGPRFGHAGLEAVRPFGDPMDGDRPEDLTVQLLTVGVTPVGRVVDQWPERLQYLKCRLETDRPRRNILAGRRLGHD